MVKIVNAERNLEITYLLNKNLLSAYPGPHTFLARENGAMNKQTKTSAFIELTFGAVVGILGDRLQIRCKYMPREIIKSGLEKSKLWKRDRK